MMYMVYGQATRFALDDGLHPGYADQLWAYMGYEQYHWQDYQEPARKYRVTITAGTTDISDTRAVIGLMWRDHLAPAEFERLVYDVLDVKTERL
jgi:hypothetical protein